MRIPEDYDGFSITVDRLVDLGSTVLMEGRCTGAGRGSGRPLDAQVAHVWELEDGKVVRFQQYVNTAHLQEVLTTEDARSGADVH